jgi:O-antigen ligase
MPDLALLRIRNQTLLTARQLYKKCLLGCFILFLVAGNFFRFLPQISFLEALLYTLGCPLYFLRIRKSQLLILGILLSTCYGALVGGFQLLSFLYSLKLIGMIGTGVALGEALGPNRWRGLNYFLYSFVAVLAVGGAIFLFFPEADLFFSLLAKHGIHFFGDPHKRRFISPFFDPNYYGAIACIPLLLAAYMRKWTLFALFFLSILLTFSRSGIATACLLLVPLYRPRLLFVGLSLLLLLYFQDELLYFLNRTLHLFDDPSTQARLYTFQEGLAQFLKRPLFGIGYNYLPLSVDSSLLVTLLCFGAVPTLALFSLLFLIPLGSKIERSLYFYLMICILFTAQFNNLLYYPYWLITMIALFTLLQRTEDEMCSSA